ncbi:multiple cyclophane-containing RiPP AmcA [Amycolatopsis sp. CA-230715]|uniref:multiple cyclophane-containing RiPP AmcA n=1 Tax=Amycolatopsis sp. CA-230715 TaxID=2745196 RepID=UPI003FA41BDE
MISKVSLRQRVESSSKGIAALLERWRPTRRQEAMWDSRTGWDDKGGGFDNRPTWDNWSKRQLSRRRTGQLRLQ